MHNEEVSPGLKSLIYYVSSSKGQIDQILVKFVRKLVAKFAKVCLVDSERVDRMPNYPLYIS